MRKSFLENRGVESEDELDEILTAYREAEEEVKDEVERWESRYNELSEKHTELTGRLTDLSSRYERALKSQALQQALLAEGVRPDRVKHAIRHADLSSLEVDENEEVSGIEQAVKSLKEEVPEWFTSKEERRGIPPAPQGSGSSKLSHEEKLKRSNLANLRF
ncbi:hypothetical protein [Rubrobacter calidifluminis]|uniref:phage scaffolding protein n=1 Tax=Rubrobacter calidifluminis TaxID=1392640 RepID=UPI00235DCF67|nr:hypothetical protein [Rubrobacter calidifluminis]